MAERERRDDELAADDTRAALDRIGADLLAVLQRHAAGRPQRLGLNLTAHAVIEFDRRGVHHRHRGDARGRHRHRREAWRVW